MNNDINDLSLIKWFLLQQFNNITLHIIIVHIQHSFSFHKWIISNIPNTTFYIV